MERALSEREEEVTKWAARGLSNLEIGEKLGIEIGTVKLHLHHIFVKLGLRNRTELTLYALGKRMRPRR